ncbi:MAG: histidine kinase [Oscillospiraceae bacterium]|jgi:sensor histidine kinase YesM|nr:histidine kinase [Oscillospiraceae bacterium]
MVSKKISVRAALRFFLAGSVLLFLVCLWLVRRLGIWRLLFGEGRVTPDNVLAIAVILGCVINVFLFVRLIFRIINDLEKLINTLKEAAEKNGANFDDIMGGSKHSSLTGLLQFLLQREAAAQIMTKQAEINALQNQINPHFLYNTLETIRGQALCSGETQIAETTKALADIFRYNISKKGTMIHLTEELANIDSYIKIQRIRFNDKFELVSQIDEDAKEILIPKLLVQPVIENALRHGLEPKSGKGEIILRAFRTEKSLEISVLDDGVGMPPEKLSALNDKLSAQYAGTFGTVENNIGLENVNERIKLIYGQEYGISVMSAQNAGTKVTLSLGILPSFLTPQTDA